MWKLESFLALEWFFILIAYDWGRGFQSGFLFIKNLFCLFRGDPRPKIKAFNVTQRFYTKLYLLMGYFTQMYQTKHCHISAKHSTKKAISNTWVIWNNWWNAVFNWVHTKQLKWGHISVMVLQITAKWIGYSIASSTLHHHPFVGGTHQWFVDFLH